MDTPVDEHLLRPSALRPTPAFLDIEASGFGGTSYPIEIGYVLPDGSSFCTLIQPEPHWTHWDDRAERVHQLSRDTVQRHGRPVTEVVDWLNEQLKGLTLYSDSWGHDYAWLAVLYEAAEKTPRFRLESLRKLLTEDDAANWKRVKDGVTARLTTPRHRASSDAWVLQQTWLQLQRGVAPVGR